MSVFVAFDLETTGLSSQNDRIVEIGAVRFDETGLDLGTFHSLVNPLRPVNPQARAVHGISDDELEAAPHAFEVMAKFLAWFDEFPGTTLLAHNASFDAAFLGAELARQELLEERTLEVIDTLPLSRIKMPATPNHRLETLAIWLDLDLAGAHRALTDSMRLKGLWLALTQGETPQNVVSYAVAAPSDNPPVPLGWATLSQAMTTGQRVRISYEGGSHGLAPREITPKRFRHKGGIAYLVAECHASAIEKNFRLDRVLKWEVV